MVTPTQSDPSQQNLETLIRQWERRLQMQRFLRILPRALLLGVIVSLAVIVLALLTGWLPVSMLLWLALGIVVVVLLSTVLAVFLFGKRGLAAAQQFDQLFGLQERLTTALELMEGRIQAAPEIAQVQINDAYAIAQEVNPRKHIHFKVRVVEWVTLLGVTTILLAFLWFAPQTGAGGGLSAEQVLAIEEAEADVRDVIEDVATDASLTADERESLLETLEVSLDELQMPNTSPEEAFATLGQLETDLRSQVEAQREEINARQQALEDFAQALQDAAQNLGVSPANQSEALAESAEADLANLLDAVNQLSPEQQAQLAEAFEAAVASALEDLPELGEDLTEAAQALQESDLTGAEENLQQALEELRDALEAQSQQTDVSDALEAAVEVAQQAAENIAQAEQQANAEAQQMPPDAEMQAEAQQAQQAGDQAPQAGEEAGAADSFEVPDAPEAENAAQQPNQTQPDQAAESSLGQPNQSSGQQSQPGQGNPQNQANGQSAQGQAQQGRAQQEMQAAQNQADAQSGSNQATSDGEERPVGTSQDAVNTAESAGETTYDPIFAPRDIDAAGRDDIVLEPDTSDVPVVEGDFNENPDGEVTVPYNQVFSEYSDAANRALQSDYVPLGLRDVVRDYFTALEPDN